MAMKELLYRLRPFQIYIVLALSIVYFFMQLSLSHDTNALTLLVDSYHMLCNIVALSGCIMTIKHCSSYNGDKIVSPSDKLAAESSASKRFKDSKFIEIKEIEANRHAHSLRNTFGWTRIDILTMLIVGIFLAAFCFSLLLEAIQTLVHIDHRKIEQRPVAVFALSCSGLILNYLCYFLIGGYTYHQSSFLHVTTSSGNDFLDRVVSGEGIRRDNRRLAKTKRGQMNAAPIIISTSSIQSEGAATSSSTSVQIQSVSKSRKHTLNEFLRDISSTILVMIYSIIGHFADNGNTLKYVDPIISIVSCIILLTLSYPYMKESCLILLQSIPESIDIESFKADLLKTFVGIVSVHDLHIWQLTSSKYVSTVHILFHNPNVYVDIKDALVAFFQAQGITIVTIQPEFKENPADGTRDKSAFAQCLIECQSLKCIPKTCCPTNNLDVIVVGDGKKQNNYQQLKTDKISSSMLSLNVSSLTKLRNAMGSNQKIMKKSVSESYVDSRTTSADVSAASNLNVMHNNSIDELNEREFIEGCDARSDERLPPIEQQRNLQKTDSKAKHEDSSLLNGDASNVIETTPKPNEDAEYSSSKL